MKRNTLKYKLEYLKPTIVHAGQVWLQKTWEMDFTVTKVDGNEVTLASQDSKEILTRGLDYLLNSRAWACPGPAVDITETCL